MDQTRSTSGSDARLIGDALRQFEAANQRARADRPTSHSSGPGDLASGDPGMSPGNFPNYEISAGIRRGGQGVVYRGIHRATRREVAIKVLRGGRFATQSERFRFEREARVLASLRHPNVVTIFDSGVADGHAYIVMDYIAGQPLDEYVRSRRDIMSLPETLRLFATICDAVQAAHLRGITHRDLKPANIRVDEQGQPHVLDFGLAKLTESDLEDGSVESLMTQTGQFVGSVPWASPEQAAGRSEAIDVRTDVYSLGVVLYQLLTGAFPYPLGGNTREALDRILHSEPIPPRSLRRNLPADVGTIVLKCLQKDPDRRYQTAGELARDIRRCLANQPIDARRDSLAYVLRKQLRRHKLPVAVTAAFLLVIVVGFAASAVFWQRAAAERDAAQRARDNEAEQHALALANAERARAEAAKAEAVTDFLTRMLESIDPARAQGVEVTVREVLDGAAAAIESGELSEEPEVVAHVRITIGATYLAIGRYDDAERLVRQAEQTVIERLGEGHALMQRVRRELATINFRQGRYERAATAFAGLLEELEPVLGPDHPDVLALVNSLGFSLIEQSRLAEAEAILRPAIERAVNVIGSNHPTTLKMADTLGVALRTLGRPAEAEALQLPALEASRETLGDEHPDTLAAMTNLGITLRQLRNYPQAEHWLRLAVQGTKSTYGEDHPLTAKALLNLSGVLWYSGKDDEAESVMRQVVDIHRRTLAPTHPSTLLAENNLARALRGHGKLEELDALLAEMVHTRRHELGEMHVETMRAVDYRRDILLALGRTDELRAFVADALARLRGIVQRDDASPDALMRFTLLLTTCEPEDLRDPPAALETARRAAEIEHSATAQEVLARAWKEVGEFDNAIAAQRAALELIPPQDVRKRPILEEGLAELLRDSGDLSAAERWMREVLDRRLSASPAGGSDVEIALEVLGRLLLLQERTAEAEAAILECLDRRQSRLSPGHRLIICTQNVYGEVLTQFARFDEAEPLLLETHALLRDDPEASHVRRQEARARLFKLYEAWGRPDQAAHWRD